MTNKERADRALEAVRVGTDYPSDSPEELETYIGDLLANLFHLVDQHEFDMEVLLERGYQHYLAEVAEEAK